MSRSSSSPTLVNTARPSSSAVWIIVGASRGIGLEFVRQLLARGDRVYAVIRDPASASQLWSLAGSAPMANCELLECDVADEASISVSMRLSATASRLTTARDSLKTWLPEEILTELIISYSMRQCCGILMYVKKVIIELL